MGTGGTPSLGSPKSRINLLGISDGQITQKSKLYVSSKFYGQAERAISIGQLNVLLRLHIRPINVVVFHGPSKAFALGDLILRKVSRLYAFSAYPDRTSLPCYATGVTTGSQEVR